MANYETVLGHEVPQSSMSNLAGAAKGEVEYLVKALEDGKVPGFELGSGERVTVAASRAAAEWWRKNPDQQPVAAPPPQPAKIKDIIVTDDEMASVRFTGCTPSELVRQYIVHDALKAPNLPSGQLHVSIWRYDGPERVAYLLEGVGQRFVDTGGALAAEREKKEQARTAAMEELENERRGKTAAAMRQSAEQNVARAASTAEAEARAKASRLIRGGFPEAGRKVLVDAGLGS